MEAQEVLQGIGLFEGLDRDEVVSVAEVCQVRSFLKGELVFGEGSLGNELYIVRSGRVVIQMGGRGCSPATTLQVVEPNQIFGELALIDEESRSAAARALTDCEILILPRENLYRVFETNRHIGQVVMRNIAAVVASRLRKTNLQLMVSEAWR